MKWLLLSNFLIYIPALKPTASLPLKITIYNNGFKINFFSGPGLFSGAFAVSFREGMYALPGTDISQLKEDEVSFSQLVVYGLVPFPGGYTKKRLLELWSEKIRRSPKRKGCWERFGDVVFWVILLVQKQLWDEMVDEIDGNFKNPGAKRKVKLTSISISSGGCFEFFITYH